MRWRLLLVGGCLAAGLVQGCWGQSCTEIGCNSGATVTISSLETDDIRSIHACLDGDCSELSWTAAAVCTSTNGESSPNLNACLLEGDVLELSVIDNDVRDGDVLSVRIEGESAVLLEEERTLQYKDSYPNGKDCPGHCRVASVEL